jgi:hypothetical protein
MFDSHTIQGIPVANLLTIHTKPKDTKFMSNFIPYRERTSAGQFILYFEPRNSPKQQGKF